MKRFLLLLVLAFFFVSSARAEVYVLLMSLEQYHQNEHRLMFVKEDIKELSSVLEQRIKATTTSSVDLDPGLSNTSLSCYRDSALKDLDRWIAKIGSQDTAILYLAGHGIKNDEGKYFWAMNNFDEKHWAETTVSIAEIRERLSECPARYKLLFLDACYSGTSKGLDSGQSRRIQVFSTANEFAEVPDLVTIASSTEKQESWIWESMEHSLFTFWLIQAFNGAADTDGDTYITFQELKDFLSSYVPLSASLIHQEQDPVFLHGEKLGESFRFDVKPLEIEHMYQDIAIQLDIQMRIRGLRCLVIPEFSSGESFNEVDGSIGLLTQEGAAKVRKYLTKLKNSHKADYNVLSENATRELLKEGKLTFADIGTKKTWKLKTSGDSEDDEERVDSIFSGNLQTFDQLGLKFTGKLVLNITREEEEVCHSVGRMTTGFGSDKRVSDRPDYNALGMAGWSMLPPSYEKSQIQQNIPDENTPHPLSDENARNQIANIKILARPAGSDPDVKYQERELTFNGNRCDVVLNKGEEYAIQIRNNTGKKVFARVLVDGLGVLAQHVDGSKETVFAPRVSLPEARCWILDPNRRTTVKGFYAPQGFTESENHLAKDIKVEGKSKLCRFTVVDANEALSAKRDKFTDQLGLVTVGIYEAISREEAEKRKNAKGGATVGTNPGPPENADLEVVADDDEAGFPLMIVNIHYSSK